MKTELTEVSPTRKEITIEIEQAQVQSAFDRISDEFSKQAKVPGFRPGHAPRSVIKTRYKNEIRTEVLKELVPEAVNNAIIEHSLDAVSEPNVQFENEETLERLGEEALKVKVGVEVLPEIKLENYKGLEVERRTRPITDDDVDQTIQNLREASASMVAVEDRVSETGDTVTVNAHGQIVDEPDSEDIKVEDVEVVLGGPNVQPEFTENLTGVKTEEKKTFIVDYPADFSTNALAGKKVEYTLDVTAVRKRELPEVDDEWAKSLGEEFDSVETLKAKVREDLEKRAKFESDERVRGELLRKIVDAHRIEMPESLVEKQTNFLFESVLRNMMSQGIDPRTQQINWEGARDELKGQAQSDVLATLLMERIAEAENITVSSEEIEAEIQAAARQSRQSVEQLRAALTKAGGERSIAQRLRNRKALDLLLENANVTEAEWTEPSESTEATDASEPSEAKEASAATTNE
ncbi:MAG TPA: trigger factor [Pyrinomonadaceae bacterium]|nr:trigger factor [Pyrinomonadaceae bacterium]